MIAFRFIILSLCVFIFSACATQEPTVIGRSSSQYSHSGLPPKYGYRYTVRKGDTLYSIAWAIKQDFRRVAAWNGVRKPYTIYVGQRLRLYPTKTSKKSSTTTSSKASSSKKTTTQASKPVTSARPPVRSTSKKSSTSYLGPVSKWAWPTSSRKVSSRFSPSSGREGIDITGRKGDSIYSTASGQIVYAGSGLRGYGRLIIVKHNKTYLSAYAHNNRILVTEGQNVKGGQKIAEMGTGGTGRYKLHFEIRKKGTPVNPQKYLPR